MTVSCQLHAGVANDPQEVTNAHGETLVRPELDPHSVEVIFHGSLPLLPTEEAEVILESTTGNEPMSRSRQESARNRNKVIIPYRVLVVVSSARLKTRLEYGPYFFFLRRVIDQELGSILELLSLMAHGSRLEVFNH
jgi:hypothetical protein